MLPGAIGRGLVLALVSVNCTLARETAGPSIQDDEDLANRRRVMVETQIRERGIRDARVLDALRKVPRHRFVLAQDVGIAYDDHPIPIGLGQTISQPYIVAFMTEALSVAPEHKVLEIGTGSGYQAAILGELAREVYTIEIHPELAARAERVITALGYKNIRVRAGDGYNGWPQQAPFDAVMVTAAPDHVPQPLIDQVKVGGRLVVPVGTGVQQLLVYTRTETGLREESRLPVRFVPLTRKP
jgi:protein-L-isoaspartate(D-aspartate) O-methyltransferase